MRFAEEHGYDAAIQFDGDGQHNPEYIADMEKIMMEGNDIVIGSRFVSEKKPHSLRMWGNDLIEGAIWLTTGKVIHDTTSGMRLYNQTTIHKLANAVDLGPEPDTLALLIRKGAKIGEIQIKMNDRIAGESYLTLSKSIKYMSRMLMSILVLQWFRKG